MKHFLLLLLITTLFACEKDDPVTPATGRITFYRTIGGSWNLIIDGVDRGFFPQSLTQPICETPTFTSLELTVGTHTYDMKSNDGLAWGDPKQFNVNTGCKVIRTVP